MKRGTQLKLRLDIINTALAVAGVVFLVLFIRHNISLKEDNLWQFVIVVVPVALVVFPIFLVLITIWLKPLFTFLDSERPKGGAMLDQKEATALIIRAMTYPVRHITAAMICWNVAAVTVAVISALLGILSREDSLVLVNTVFIFSILINMISYYHTRLIIPPVVEEANHRAGAIDFIPQGTLSSVRSKVMTFVGAIIIFLILFFLQIVAISAVTNRKHMLNEIGGDKMSLILSGLDALSTSTGEIDCRDLIGESIRGLTEIVIVHPEGQILCGNPSAQLKGAIDLVLSGGLSQSSKLFDPLVIVVRAQNDYTVGILCDWRVFYLPVIYTSFWNLFFVFIMGLIALYLGRMIAIDIANSLTDLSGSMQTIALGEGDLTRRISHQSSREIAQLSSWFNRFISRLAELIKSSQTQARRVSTSMKQMRRHSDDFIQESQRQDNIIRDVRDAGKSFDVIGKSLSGKMQDVHKLSKRNVSSAQQGLQSIKDISEGVKQLIDTAGAATNSFQELQTRSKAINEIIEIVEKLTDQTRLLSFNAMLEAISAGEKGQRFSVVAGEVRNLADDVAGSTTRIMRIIKEIILLIDTLGEKNMQEQAQLDSLKVKISSARAQFNQIVHLSDRTTREITFLKEDFGSQQHLIIDSARQIEDMVAITEKVMASGNLFQGIIDELEVMTRRQEENIQRFKVD